MTANDLKSLHGQSVLVKSSRDGRNPPIAMRGTLEVRADGELSPPEIKLLLEFPDMFNVPAHQRTLTLTQAELAQLKPAERGGFELMTDRAIE